MLCLSHVILLFIVRLFNSAVSTDFGPVLKSMILCEPDCSIRTFIVYNKCLRTENVIVRFQFYYIRNCLYCSPFLSINKILER